jgi:hypothetical protein
MTTPCIAVPVSWLRLEQLALAELDVATTSSVRTHLDACPACAASYARITDDAWPLPRLTMSVLPASLPWWRRWYLGGGLGLAVVAAAVMLVWMAVAPTPSRPVVDTAPGVRIKGAGVVIVTLVRERNGAIAFDPSDVDPGDRWKLQITCAPGGGAWIDVAVMQSTAVEFPLAAQRIACGNQLAVPGAFRITGGGATVCVALGAAAPDRDRLRAGDRSGSVCRDLVRR